MEWQALLKPEIRDFIRRHQNDDVAALALKKPPEKDWPYKLILDQIKARQKAQIKMPGWLEHDDIILPAADVLEQASSPATAAYKAALVSGKIFADLTGGAGVDTSALSKSFEKGICIERDENAAALLAHNLPLLTVTKITVEHADAEEFAADMPPVDLVYLDPQRRDENRKGLYELSACSPDIFTLLPILKNKTQKITLKTSPVLDIHKTLNDLPWVSDVHVIEYQGDCKEVIYILNFEKSEPGKNDVPVTAVSIDGEGKPFESLTFTYAQEKDSQAEYSMPQRYLYEPGPAFQKAGGFQFMAAHYSVAKLHPHTHLYTSDEYRPGFPGRHFEILEILPVNAKKLPMKKANLTVRNFPANTPELQKKLDLKDGGDVYLFACTLSNENKVLLNCKKIQGDAFIQ